MYHCTAANLQNLQTLTQAINQAADFDTALAVTLSQVCEFTDWDYGEAWISDRDDTILKLHSAWCVHTYRESACVLALEQFRNCSEGFILHPSEGLPGRVWSSQQPEWMSDASAESETYFLRNQIAKAFAVKAGLGVPILVNSQMRAVFCFFMLEARAEDKQLVEFTLAAITQLRQVLANLLTESDERKQGAGSA
ncbi:MAG TPA: GAF domain-containing protein [Coleofasciculaceae cyanobacterium]|jgi:GAF domain-containing protein